MISKGHSSIDLLIVDVPQNLPVPGISDSSVLAWNKHSDNYFELVFYFAQSILHDDAVVLFIHSSKPGVLKELCKWAFTYGFEQICDWWSINNLLVASPNPLDEFRVRIQSYSFLFKFSFCITSLYFI